jgi:hypothetical protein
MGYVREEREEFLLVLNSVTSTPQWIRPEPRDMRKNTTAQVYSRVLPETLFCSMNPNSLSLSINSLCLSLAVSLRSHWVSTSGCLFTEGGCTTGNVGHGHTHLIYIFPFLARSFFLSAGAPLLMPALTVKSTPPTSPFSPGYILARSVCFLRNSLSLFLSLSLSLPPLVLELSP